MKAAPLLVSWHENNDPIYSAHFEPHGKGRLATSGGDCNVRLWSIGADDDERRVTYLSTLKKHTQAVNVVRWCPRGELLASAGDDGNVLLWTPSDNPAYGTSFGEDEQEDVEHWRVKTMCRSNSGAEIYDLAWSPDGMFFITGSMDNVARIYSAATGQTVRQIAEHSHYVQGVAWDPLNEYVATQSSDRSVHIYTLKTKDGQFSLNQHNKITKMDLPGRRISSHSPAPPDFSSGNHRASLAHDLVSESVGSPRLSAPGTPQSLALPMNPPPTSHSRRSSFGSQLGQSMRRSVSPSPSMPLPAVMPSASPSLSGSVGMGFRNANIYANETFNSFFRRLTFAPDGSLLFTPAGQFKTTHPSAEGTKATDEIINTVYIYTRAGLNKPPVAYLPGHKKPSIAVKCSPIFYQLRTGSVDTVEITIDSRTEGDLSPLPESLMPSKALASHSAMEPPPLTSAPSPAPSMTMPSPRTRADSDSNPPTPAPPAGPIPVFGLPYRIVYAVATQDAVNLYDTQQQKPLCVVTNLHFSTFTDISWSNDGSMLLMTSTDGFCSALTFGPAELGTVYIAPVSTHARPTPTPISVAKANSAASTPQATPTASSAPSQPTASTHHTRHSSTHSNSNSGHPISMPSHRNPSPSPFTATYGPVGGRPASPARSMSASSIATESSFARVPDQNAPPAMNNPTPSMSSVPSLAAAGSSSAIGGVPLFTPPQTPGQAQLGSVGLNGSMSNTHGSFTGTKRESNASNTGASSSENDEQGRAKRRRIAPTPVVDPEHDQQPPASAPSTSGEGSG